MKELPIVLVRIDANSRVSLLRSDDVLVAYIDEREAHDAVVLLPVRNQALEIMETLSGRHLVGLGDADGITANTMLRLKMAEVIAAGFDVEI